jgi:hypothetical protein
MAPSRQERRREAREAARGTATGAQPPPTQDTDTDWRTQPEDPNVILNAMGAANLSSSVRRGRRDALYCAGYLFQSPREVDYLKMAAEQGFVPALWRLAEYFKVGLLRNFLSLRGRFITTLLRSTRVTTARVWAKQPRACCGFGRLQMLAFQTRVSTWVWR